MKLVGIRIYFPQAMIVMVPSLGVFFFFFSFQESAQNKGNFFLLTSVSFFKDFYQESQWTVRLRGDRIKVWSRGCSQHLQQFPSLHDL